MRRDIALDCWCILYIERSSCLLECQIVCRNGWDNPNNRTDQCPNKNDHIIDLAFYYRILKKFFQTMGFNDDLNLIAR